MVHTEQSLLPAAFAFAVSLLVYVYAQYYARWRARTRGRPFPPGPPGLPIVGNVLNVPKFKPWFGYKELCAMYGNIVHLRALGQSIVVLGSAEVVFEYLDKRSANTSDRKQTPMIELSGASLSFVLFPYGQWWRRHRRVFWQHFYPRAALEYRPVQRNATRRFLHKLLKSPSNLTPHIRWLFASAVLKVLYSIDVLPENDPYVAIVDDAMKGPIQGLVPGKFLVEYLPFLRHIPTWLPGAKSQRLFKKWQAEADRLKNLTYAHTKDTMENDGESQRSASCIIGQLIAGLDAFNEHTRPDEEELAKIVGATALEAGADTTYATIQALFLAVSLNPDVLHKAQAELDTIVGPDRLPEFDDEDSLLYIQAIVLETMRWHTVLPYGVPHCTVEDDELHGYFIPAGTVLIPNAWAYMHDPEAYDDPDAFRPERYIKDGKIDKSVRSPLDFVFGFGRRICPGRYFALSGLFITVASVLHVFDIGPPLDEDGHPIVVTPAMADGIISYPEDCRCTIKPRSAGAEALILAHAMKAD